MSWNETRGHPLDGPYRKLARAKEHLDALRREIQTFTDREPYEWSTEFYDRSENEREYTVTAEVHEEPDVGWGLIAGDVIQNLRAALDILIWGISDPQVRNHLTAFPIYWPRGIYERNAPEKIAGISEPARALVERSQPYHWGAGASGHPLAILKHLSNTDKHQTLLPVTLARRHEHVAGYGEFKVAGFTFLHEGPVWDGTEVMKFITRGEPPEEVNVYPYVSFEVTIEGRTLIEIESIFEFIGHSILSAFDRS